MPDTKSYKGIERSQQPADLKGRLLALDLGDKRVGIAVSDPVRLTVRPLAPLRRRSWKKLLQAVAELIRDFDAQGLVIGLPLNLDGTEGEAATETRRRAEHFKLSLNIPVFLQDERLTSREAETRLRDSGYSPKEIQSKVDSEAAAIILSDFISERYSQTRPPFDSS